MSGRQHPGGHRPIPIGEIRSARDRIRGIALRTPLVRLGVEDAPAEIYLKLENLQPIGSFKIRGAGNAMAMVEPDRLAGGVYTASAGNMAQGVAWNARLRGVPCTVVVPDTAPDTKLAAVSRLGAEHLKLPFDEWWNVMVERGYGPLRNRLFIHPFSDPAVMAGNGTIGLEVVEDLPEVDAVVVPFGGGGLSCGIASAMRAVRPRAMVFGAEVETAAPLAAAFGAGSPKETPYSSSFVDGIGSKRIMDDMWPLAQQVLAGALVSSLKEIADAIRILAERNHVIAEGAGAAGVAAALAGRAGSGKVVCVVSGGNIDPAKLAAILSGTVP